MIVAGWAQKPKNVQKMENVTPSKSGRSKSKPLTCTIVGIPICDQVPTKKTNLSV